MIDLYIITGYNNVSDWIDKDLDGININSVHHKTFDNQKDKQLFIDALYFLDNNMHNMSGNYILITENDYNKMMTI